MQNVKAQAGLTLYQRSQTPAASLNQPSTVVPISAWCRLPVKQIRGARKSKASRLAEWSGHLAPAVSEWVSAARRRSTWLLNYRMMIS
jgi:hypothetical protein